MALASRSRCSRDRRSRGDGDASCLLGLGAALSFFRGCSAVEGEAGIFAGVLALGDSVLATLGSTPMAPPCVAPVTGGSRGGALSSLAQPAARRKKRSPTMRGAKLEELIRLRLELSQRVDPLLRSRMAGKEPSPAGALCLQEPGQRVDHQFLGIPGTAEEIHTVAVRVVFLLAAIAAGNQGAGDGCETAAAREEVVENDPADAPSGAERLRLGDMTEIVVGELMGQDASELVIAGLQKQPGGDIELSPAGAGRVDVRIVHDRHPDLIRGARMIHGSGERDHDEPKALGLFHIERTRRRLGSAGLAGLARRRDPEPGAPSGQDEENESDKELCSHGYASPIADAGRIAPSAARRAPLTCSLVSCKNSPARRREFPPRSSTFPVCVSTARIPSAAFARTSRVFPCTEPWISLPQSQVTTAPVNIPRIKTPLVRILVSPLQRFQVRGEFGLFSLVQPQLEERVVVLEHE